MEKQKLTPCQWFEISDYIQSKQLDDVYFIRPNETKVHKLTPKTKATISELAEYEWFIDETQTTYN